MRTTIDHTGRLVVPKALRERVGLTAGEVEIRVAGSGLLLEPVASDVLVSEGDLLLLPDAGAPLTTDDIRELRLGDQR